MDKRKVDENGNARGSSFSKKEPEGEKSKVKLLSRPPQSTGLFGIQSQKLGTVSLSRGMRSMSCSTAGASSSRQMLAMQHNSHGMASSRGMSCKGRVQSRAIHGQRIQGGIASPSRHPAEAVDHPVRVRIAQYDTLLHGHPRPSLRGKFLGSRQGF